MKNRLLNLLHRVTRLGPAALILLSFVSSQAQPAPVGASTEATAPGQGVAAPPPAVSPAAAEVIRLAQSGVAEDVVMAYIQNSSGAFNLTADQILYLRDLGLTSPEISGMLTRDITLRTQPQSAPQQPVVSAPAVPAAEPPPNSVPEPTVPVEAPLTPPAAPPAQVNYFYSDLAPYGTWVDLEGFGWCWQPSAVVIHTGWRPYCDGGHWVWTDCGWYWQSDYSWGWAPFHYGRWHLHPRCGWVWMPDTVWAPAWVIWRSSGDYCGWAPVPPHAVFVVGVGWRFNGVHVGVDFDFGLHADHFTFVALHDFGDHDFHHHRLAPVEVTKIYNHTTIINNYTVNNTVIVNRGLPVERVAKVSSTPIPRASVRELPAGSTRAVGTVQPGGHGTPVVYRPQLHAPARPVPVAVQKVDDRHPVIQHTATPVPVATARGTVVERGPVGGLHSTQSGAPGTSSHSGFGRPTPNPGSQPIHRNYEPAPRSQPTPRTQPSHPQESAPRAQSAPLVPPVSQPTTRVTQMPPASAPPVQRSPQFTERVEPTENRTVAPHVYQPKGYYQAQDPRSPGPGSGSHHAAPPPQSQSSNSQGHNKHNE